ncbi:hypothetical protein OF83DRAFT_286324 [Amylostereum chailletii]|nr:hypothetical protein OF83DRAFT_286324 [Amylostereum chailletii]
MSPTPAVVQLSSLAEVSELAAMASRALKDDASRRAMLGGNFELSDELYASMIRAAYLAGKAYAVKQDGKFISIALWFEMSNALFSTAEQRALGFDKLFQKLSPETQYWWTDTYPETINKWQAQIFTEEVCP